MPTAKGYLDTLSKLYDVDAPSLKRSLKRELFTIKMDKNEIVASFFSRVTQLKEQLSAIAAATEPDDFIGAAIDGLPDSWSPFIASVTGRSKSQSPSFEEFWHKCIEEEARLQRRSRPSGKTGEKDLVLSAKFKDKRSRSKKP